jgi:hypothetical protein
MTLPSGATKAPFGCAMNKQTEVVTAAAPTTKNDPSLSKGVVLEKIKLFYPLTNLSASGDFPHFCDSP